MPAPLVAAGLYAAGAHAVVGGAAAARGGRSTPGCTHFVPIEHEDDQPTRRERPAEAIGNRGDDGD